MSTDLTKTEKGEKVLMHLVADLVEDGVIGDNEREGNEEAMQSYSQVINIDLISHGVRNKGNLAEQKTVIKFREMGKRGSPAAYNLRVNLKAAGIKARVVQDGYSAIRVYVAEEKNLEAAKVLADKYEDGYFDGMQDMHVSVPNPWGSAFGQVDYVFVNLDRNL